MALDIYIYIYYTDIYIIIHIGTEIYIIYIVNLAKLTQAGTLCASNSVVRVAGAWLYPCKSVAFGHASPRMECSGIGSKLSMYIYI